MSLSIDVSSSFIAVQQGFNQNESKITQVLKKLSSGLRVNNASDDASALSAVARFAATVNGLEQAALNANAGVSTLQTAGTALSESTAILQRIRELAVQSANTSNNTIDRAALQGEVNQLTNELNRIAQSTRYANKPLLDGTFTNQSFQVGAYENGGVSFSLINARPTVLGNYEVSSATGASALGSVSALASTLTSNDFLSQDITINGNGIASTGIIADASSAAEITTLVNNKTVTTGVSASANTTAILSNLSADGVVSFALQGDSSSSSASISASVMSGDLAKLKDAINAKTSVTGISATGSGGTITLSNETGEDIALSDFTHDAVGNQTMDFGTSTDTVSLTDNGTADSATVGGIVHFSSNNDFSVQTTSPGTFLLDPSSNATRNVLSEQSVSTQAAAQDALRVIDSALDEIHSAQAEIGALENRLLAVMSSNSIAGMHATDAMSRIQEVDFKKEVSAFARLQIIRNSNIALLSQANAQHNNVLNLLLGSDTATVSK